MVRPFYIFLPLLLDVGQASLDLDDETSQSVEPAAPSSVPETSPVPERSLIKELASVPELSASPGSKLLSPAVLARSTTPVPETKTLLATSAATQIVLDAPASLFASKAVQQEPAQVLPLRDQTSPGSVATNSSVPSGSRSHQPVEDPLSRLPVNLPNQPPVPSHHPPLLPDSLLPQPDTNPLPQPTQEHQALVPQKLSQGSKMSRVSPVILVHGGAGDIPDSGVSEKIEGVKRAALAGFKVLKETDSVLDAIEASINIMEDLDGFNAGRGSVLTLTGEVEMEALITEGKDLRAGAITLAKNIQYPISVARKVMDLTPHTFLGGSGLEDFINKSDIPRVGDDWLITDRAKYALEKFIEQGGPHLEAATEIGKRPGDVGTVGAVAVDTSGHVGSGTSTGGITGKYKGRIGDTPQLGSGGYSDDKVGTVSTTGYGEAIMRYNLAHRILSKMETGINAQAATKSAVDGMTERIHKTAGAITLSTSGDVGIWFSSKRMAWAYVKDGELHYGIEHGQHEVEKL